MRISDWSSDVCSSDLLSRTSFVAQARSGASGNRQTLARSAVTDSSGQTIDPPDREPAHHAWTRCRRASISRSNKSNDVRNTRAFARTAARAVRKRLRSEEHTSELQSLMRISYAVFCLNKKTKTNK